MIPICFAHYCFTVLHFSLFYCTFYFLFLFYLYIYTLVWCYFYIINFYFIFYFILFLYSLHCPLSGPDLTYISRLIIPCIIYHVTNKETLNLGLHKQVSSEHFWVITAQPSHERQKKALGSCNRKLLLATICIVLAIVLFFFVPTQRAPLENRAALPNE